MHCSMTDMKICDEWFDLLDRNFANKGHKYVYKIPLLHFTCISLQCCEHTEGLCSSHNWGITIVIIIIIIIIIIISRYKRQPYQSYYFKNYLDLRWSTSHTL
jgi:hypothetical protein